MSLQDVTTFALFKEVIDSEFINKHCKPRIPNDLNKILIVDANSMSFLREIIKSSQLTSKGFITTQDINVLLQPLPIHLIYFIEPTTNNIKIIVDTFSDPKSPFLTAHIFTTTKISEDAIKMIRSQPILVAKLMTLKELPFSFTVEAPNIFTLAPYMTIPFIYNSKSARENTVQDISTRIMNLLSVMNDCPSVRYMASSSFCENIASTLASLLVGRSSISPNFGKSGSEKKQSVLLIIERNFDPRPPFIHDLTLEPMARDILDVKNNCIEFNKNTKDSFKLYFDASDPVWQSLRYKHIADVMSEVNTKITELNTTKKLEVTDENMSVSSLRKLMTKYPAYRVEFRRYQGLMMLDIALLEKYKSNDISSIAKIEQNLATNETITGEPVPDNPVLLANLLEDITSPTDKFRLIALFALKKDNGLTKPLFEKLVEISHIDFAKKCLSALQILGFPIIEDSTSKRPRPLPRCPYDATVSTGYDDSRYIPIIWDILRRLTGQNLDETLFPFMGEKTLIKIASNENQAKGFEFGKYSRKSAINVKKNKPRIYVFIVGGVSYSELRLLYHAENVFPDYDLCLG
ncbi:hypothetical protein HZS_4719, partial [Henneguya salminicola]